jgi:hypothetical protein
MGICVSKEIIIGIAFITNPSRHTRLRKQPCSFPDFPAALPCTRSVF